MRFVEGLDDAIVGVATIYGKPVVVYSEDRIIFGLMKNMSEEDALDQYSFNIINAFNGEGDPVIVSSYNREEIEREYGVNKSRGQH